MVVGFLSLFARSDPRPTSDHPVMIILLFYFLGCASLRPVRSAKPEARIFECFLERLAASEAGNGLSASDCVFIDDKEANVEAARALGFHGIWFNAKLHTVERLTAGLIALGVDAAERLPELAA